MNRNLNYLTCFYNFHLMELKYLCRVKKLRVVINVLTNLKRFHRPVSSSLSI